MQPGPLFLLLLLPCVCSQLHSPARTTKSTSKHRTTTSRITSTHIRSIQIITRPHPTFLTHTFRPTSDPVHTQPPHRTGQKVIAIIFEVIGGLVLLGLLIAILRCLHVYKKTPKRDRIAEVLNRHHLQRELAELERNPVLLRRSSLREPAPPYFPPPPSYEAVRAASDSTTNVTLATASRPQGPSSSRRSLSSPIPPPISSSLPNG